MKIKIKKYLFGFKINCGVDKYSATSSIFSFTTKLKDSNKKILLTAKRSNWWRMDFDCQYGNSFWKIKIRDSNVQAEDYKGNVIKENYNTDFLFNEEKIADINYGHEVCINLLRPELCEVICIMSIMSYRLMSECG